MRVELYDTFPMHSFTRMQWLTNKKVKKVWESRFAKASRLFFNLEHESVIHGLRDVTTAHIPHVNYDVVVRELNKKGLIFLPSKKIAPFTGKMNYHPPIVQGQPWSYYGVLANRIDKAEAFAHATEMNDNMTLGKLLGYPACCSKFFEDTFQSGYVDPVWQQALQTKEKYIVTKEEQFIRLKNTDWRINPMLNMFPIGVQFHTRCSFHCESSLILAKEWISLATELKIDGLKEAEMFLRMPMEWDCYKGIAYIKSPLFKISTASNQTKRKYIVQVEGDFYPEEGANGLVFPYNEKTPIAFLNLARGNGIDQR